MKEGPADASHHAGGDVIAGRAAAQPLFVATYRATCAGGSRGATVAARVGKLQRAASVQRA